MEINNHIKTSIGIACCHKNKILLVCRRVTYAYTDLVLGRYPVKNISKIKYLLNNMTAREHSELATLNFARIWWDVTHIETNTEIYEIKRSTFLYVFGDEKQYGIYNLKKLIKSASPVYSLWEIPKGKLHTENETDLNAAIREFKEETNIDKKYYNIIFNVINYSYIDNNIKYSINYYPAILTHEIMPKIKSNNPSQINEICDIRWMDIQTIKNMCSARLYNLSKRILHAYYVSLKQLNITKDAQQNLRIAAFLAALNSPNHSSNTAESQNENCHH